MKKTLTVTRADLKNTPLKSAKKETVGTAPKKRDTKALSDLLKILR